MIKDNLTNEKLLLIKVLTKITSLQNLIFLNQQQIYSFWNKPFFKTFDELWSLFEYAICL